MPIPSTLRAPARLLAAASVFLAGSAGAEVYPTDRCVSDKMLAAARTCFTAFHAEALELRRSHLPLPPIDAAPGIEARLTRVWEAAEAVSSSEGVDCAQTTATSDALTDLLIEQADAFAALVSGGLDRDRGKDRRCGARMISRAGYACFQLLHAESRHLVERDIDRDRSALGERETRARAKLDRRLDRDAQKCQPDAGPDELAAALDEAVEKISTALTVSPRVSTEWTGITPEPVEYEGVLRSPICSGKTPYHYFVKRGTENKVLLYYQGGGACWDYTTCIGIPIYKRTASLDGDNPADVSSGFADFSNPENPFRDWNIVFMPYCTGDVHWGDVTFTHEIPPFLSGDIEHRGFTNAKVAEKWAREHFVNPDQVFVTGSSAGAYGAVVNALQYLENVYPSADFAVLGDAGNGVITQEFLENDLAKWGIENNLPEWIPGLNVPLTELTAADLYIESAKFYPRARFATYTSAYDGGTGGQSGFFQVMRNIDQPLFWFNWWESSCAWNEEMLALNAAASAGADNFRSYVGTGSNHTMWGSSRVYTDTTGGVPPLVDWIQAMVDGSDAWVNVQADDFGLLLPGHPRPDPPVAPFTAEGRIVCDGS